MRARALLAGILILALSGVAGTALADPPEAPLLEGPPAMCSEHAGPPSCAGADWLCVDPETAARIVARPEQLARDHQALVTLIQRSADVRMEYQAEMARVELEAALWREGTLVGRLRVAERELLERERGHPTWVVIVSVVGTAVVVGTAAGLSGYYLAR